MPERFTYLVLELGWAIPVLALQWLVQWRDLWAARRIIPAAILLPSAYLTVADGVAIHNRIWTFHEDRILGLTVAGVPIEEAIFFLLTNALVVQAVILVSARLRARGVTAPFS